MHIVALEYTIRLAGGIWSLEYADRLGSGIYYRIVMKMRFSEGGLSHKIM